jgi:predicted nucleic acid-binding protein
VILLDTSGLLPVLDRSEPRHAACAGIVQAANVPLLLSPFVLAELDYLLGSRVGAQAQIALLDEVVRGAYRLEPFGPADVMLARKVMARYARLALGLADASIVVLAERHGLRDVLTLDERHFRTVRTLSGKRFRLLPVDS